MQSMSKPDLSADPGLAECLNLVRGFVEALFVYVEQATGKRISSAALKTTEQIERILRSRIEGMVQDHVARAFDRMVAEHPQGASVSYTLRHPERSRHLLRLLACSFSELVATNEDGLRHLYPKVLFDGIEGWTAKVLGGEAYRDVNQKALEALGQVSAESAEDDRAIWLRVTTDEQTSRLYYAVVIPLLLHFGYDFDCTRNEMQRVVSATTNSVVSLTAEQWSVLFNRLFSPLFRCLGDREAQGRIDEVFSDGTALQAARVYADYRRWLKANRLPEPRADATAPCAAARV